MNYINDQSNFIASWIECYNRTIHRMKLTNQIFELQTDMEDVKKIIKDKTISEKQ
jgi:hypothetical protein